MFEAIIAAGERLSRTAGLRAVVLTGAGRGFSAGLDKETFAATAARRRAPGLAELMPRTHGIANAWQQAAYIWRTLPVPVIAAIQALNPALSITPAKAGVQRAAADDGLDARFRGHDRGPRPVAARPSLTRPNRVPMRRPSSQEGNAHVR